MSTQLWVSIIGGGFGVLVAIVTPYAVVMAKRLNTMLDEVRSVQTQTKDIQGQTNEIHGQTVNHHPESPNMREENDGRHAETMRMFKHMDHRLNRVVDLQDALLVLGIENRQMIEDMKGKQS